MGAADAAAPNRKALKAQCHDSRVRTTDVGQAIVANVQLFCIALYH